MRKQLIAALAAVTLLAGNAWSHGEAEARHGGIAQSASDMVFELVPGPDGATLYLSDHGKPFPAEGVSGKLTVLTGSEKTETPLAPTTGNTLEAKGAKLVPGSKAIAVITLANKKTVTVRFTVK